MLIPSMVRRFLAAGIDLLFWSILLVVVTGGFDLQTSIGKQPLRIDATRPDLLVLLYLLLLLAWRHGRNPLSDLGSIRLLGRLYDRVVTRGGPVVAGAVGLAGVVFLLLPQVRHVSFRTGIDLALFGQAYWNTLQGRFLVSSIHGGLVLWGEHFNPIVLGILPLYRLWPSPETLLALQSLALLAAAIPLYLLARLELQDRALSTTLTAAFLLYLPLRLTNIFDFHPIALAVPLILAAFYAMRRERYGWFVLWCLLIGATKETGPIAVASLGIACAFLNRRRWLGGAVTALACGWLLLNLLVVMPHFNPAAVQTQLDRYGYLGGGFGEILRTLLTRPIYVLSENLSARELFYPVRILAPVAFLPALTPVGLLTLPYLAVNILEHSGVQVWLVHYQAELAAFVFIAAVFGARRLQATGPSRRLAAAVLAGSFLFFGQSDAYRLREAWPTDDTARLHRVLAQLPEEAPVSAQAAIAPHLTRRPWLQIFPEIDAAEWVVVDYGLDPWPVRPDRFNRTVKRLRRAGFNRRFDDGQTRIYQAARP